MIKADNVAEHIQKQGGKIDEYYADEVCDYNWFPLFWAKDEKEALALLLALHDHLEEIDAVDDFDHLEEMEEQVRKLTDQIKNNELDEEQVEAVRKQLPVLTNMVEEKRAQLLQEQEESKLNPKDFVVTKTFCRVGMRGENNPWLWVCKEDHPKAKAHWQLVRADALAKIKNKDKKKRGKKK